MHCSMFLFCAYVLYDCSNDLKKKFKNKTLKVCSESLSHCFDLYKLNQNQKQK